MSNAAESPKQPEQPPGTSSDRSPAPAPLRRLARTTLPTEVGVFDAYAYLDPATGTDHVALVLGDVATRDDERAPLVRVHSECLTGDALGSTRCDCGDQLLAALRAIAREGRGVLVYLRGHEGRGIGLGAKLRAYALQDGGLDTVDANLALGLGADLRSYDVAAHLLADLGVQRVRLLSSNPVKQVELTRAGIEVAERISLPVPPRPENQRYLRTKQERMGHQQPQADDDVWSELLAGRLPVAVTEEAQTRLLERYAPLLSTGGPLVIGQLAQSLDGFIAARTGDAVYVSGEADREHLHRLRALVDAVVVGVGTVVVDDCRLTVRAVPGPSPVRVVLDPSARMPRTARVLTEGEATTLWMVADGAPEPELPGGLAPHVELVRLPTDEGRFDPHEVLKELARRGLHRVLVEGGGRIVSAFFTAQALDRIFLTVAPVLIGDGVPGIRFSGPERMANALRPPTRRFLLGDDVCVELDLAAARRRAAGNLTEIDLRGDADAAVVSPG